MIRKILYSPGFGAGWVSWNREAASIMLTWPPLVEAIEKGECPTDLHPAVISMLEAIEKAGLDRPYLGGLRGLVVATVSGPVRINEYDGSESYEELGNYKEWY